ncbi:MAG: cupin domain-containing protein [Methanomicrobiales archaeon]|nr:cupin domain-containing protein [Methanomicrobiales archaeon]
MSCLIGMFALPSGSTSRSTNQTNISQTNPAALTRLEYYRVYSDSNGITHLDTVRVEQNLMRAAPPAAPFYVSADNPSSRYLFYTFEPGWIGEPHPAPHRQFLILLSGKVEVETGDCAVKRLGPGAIVLLEDTWGKGHTTRNIGDGYADFLVVRAPATG